jgi:hypothetical protein
MGEVSVKPYPCFIGIPKRRYVAKSKSSFNGAALELIILIEERSYFSTIGSLANNTTSLINLKR